MLTFANAALLAGLAAVALPPLIHFFSRRRIDEHDWAAMQFLTVSKRTKRKIYFEQFLLMLLRMLVIGLLALALAAPVVTSSLFNRLGLPSGERDIVILIDGSASMACKTDSVSAHDAAKVWAANFLDTLRPGDRVAIFQARHQPIPILGNLSGDLDQAKNALELLSPPRGGVDWPGCVQAASKQLEAARAERDIVIITDGQRNGWADETTLPRWELGGRAGRPRIWVTSVAANRPSEPFNYSLEPLVAARGVASADREVRFRSALRTAGQRTGPPLNAVKLEIDGRASGEVSLAGTPADAVRGIAFSQRFSVGSHLVTLKCDGDDFVEDNRQDFALEVLPAVPVLIVDGTAPARRGEFLRDALAPAKDTTPAFLVKLISPSEFTANLLTADVKGPGTPPRVVMLSNLPSLAVEQNAAIEKFLTDGGSVLATLGDKVDAAAWNRVSFRAGQGWLPARLVEIVSGEAQPLPESFVHPAVEVFKEPLPGGLHTASFPQRWKVDLAAGVNGTTGTAIARLTDREPFIVERGIGRGRAGLCVVPLDNSWGTNLAALPDFVRLAHELLYYLAGAKAAERNLAPGQPIVFTPRPPEPPAGVTVQSPDGASRTLPVKAWPLAFGDTRDAGAYRLTTATGRVHYYAVHSDPQESVLTPCSAEDRNKVAEIVPGLQYIESPNDMAANGISGPQTREMWWMMILILLILLFCEMFYTRRLASKALQQ
jgi:hypothetical protein